MLYAVKANRQYVISEEEKQKYINLGYKIAKLEKGKLVIEEVETEESNKIAELKEEIKALKSENKTLVEELAILKEAKKGMTKEEAEAKQKTKGEGK